VGLREVVDEDYLQYRIASVRYLGEHISADGVPIVQPPGGHAIYIDAARFLPHIPPAQLPGQALVAELYLAGGIRAVEIGTVMFGRRDPATGEQSTGPHGTGAAGHPATRLHAEPHRLRGRAHLIESYLDRVAARTPVNVERNFDLEKSRLSRREREVLELLAVDENLYGIAEKLNVSYYTVRNHVQHILGKMGVHSTLEAVALYLLAKAQEAEASD
jgi:DNA-binding CsgD family transcriptional regulator